MHSQIDLSMQSDLPVRHRRQLGMDLILFPFFELSFLIKMKSPWWTISFLTTGKDVMIDYLLTNPSRMKEEREKRPIRLRLIFSEASNGNNQQSITLPQIYTFHKAMSLKRSCPHRFSHIERARLPRSDRIRDEQVPCQAAMNGDGNDRHSFPRVMTLLRHLSLNDNGREARQANRSLEVIILFSAAMSRTDRSSLGIDRLIGFQCDQLSLIIARLTDD